ncbi:MAG: ATP-binding cassette domain-containing protein [Pedococcus sp.]
MNTTDTLAVNARGLLKTFGDQRAVDGIDLEVRRGEVFGVLGPNGAGKTTMLKMLATLLPIDGGTAKVFGHDVRREGHVVRQLLGMAGQYASVDENLTATENLLLFGRLQGLSRAESRRRAGTLLEQFDLTEAASKPISAFSGGMRRRLDLAASLITRPPLAVTSPTLSVCRAAGARCTARACAACATAGAPPSGWPLEAMSRRSPTLGLEILSTGNELC